MEEVHGLLNMADKVALLIIYLYSFLGKTKNYAMKKIPTAENCYEKHVSNKTGGVLYYMWMLPSKVMPYLKTGSTFDGFIDCTLEWFYDCLKNLYTLLTLDGLTV